MCCCNGSRAGSCGNRRMPSARRGAQGMRAQRRKGRQTCAAATGDPAASTRIRDSISATRKSSAIRNGAPSVTTGASAIRRVNARAAPEPSHLRAGSLSSREARSLSDLPLAAKRDRSNQAAVRSSRAIGRLPPASRGTRSPVNKNLGPVNRVKRSRGATSRAAASAGPGNGKPREQKPWSGKPREEKPWRDKPPRGKFPPRDIEGRAGEAPRRADESTPPPKRHESPDQPPPPEQIVIKPKPPERG